MKAVSEIRRENLKSLAGELGGVSRLAERIERSQAQVSQWINASKDSKSGKPRTISDRSARFIERTLDLPVNWLDHDHSSNHITITDQAHGTDEGTLRFNVAPGPDIRGRIPLISWTTAGNWSEIVDNFAPGDAEEWIATTANVGTRSYALRIRGESMTPTIPDGAIVIVDPDAEARHRSIVIVRQNGDSEATCKRLIYEGDRPMIRPDNPAYSSQIAPLEPDAKIIGVVRQVVMDLE